MAVTGIGIAAYGAYVPELRLSRSRIAQATGWMNPEAAKHAAGERAVCAWDEDSITMAVAAARDCADASLDGLQSLSLASTTLPFADRSNAVLVGEALGLGEGIRAMDCTGSQRAATSALIAALEQGDGSTLVIGSDCRAARTGSPQEMQIGHAAAAVMVDAADQSIARCVAHRSISRDLVDHYRTTGEQFDHNLESRWVRDEGLLKIVPDLVRALLADAGLEPESVDHAVLPGSGRVATKLCREVGIEPDHCVADLSKDCGDAGVADPLLRLCGVLEGAAAGQRILLVAFGQGADALLFETTQRVTSYRPRLGVAGHLARRREEANYVRYLAHRGLVEVDWGNRAEYDNRAALTTFYRKRDDVTGFVGGQCELCGTIQFPRARACVNPECRAIGQQKAVSLSRVSGKVKTFTEDWLAFTPDPPFRYGNIEFDVGGNLLMEIINTDSNELRVGMPVEMCFRVKEFDQRRHFPRYFWKASSTSGAG